MNGKAWKWAMTTALWSALAGCSSLHLYHEDADKLATAAKTSYDSSKLLTVLKGETANFDVIEKYELDASAKVVLASRDMHLLALLSNTQTPFAPAFDKELAQRIEVLAGTKNWEDINALLKDSTVEVDALNLQARADKSQRGALVSVNPGFAKLLPCQLDNAQVYASGGLAGARLATRDGSLNLDASSLAMYEIYVTQTCATYLTQQRTARRHLMEMQARSGGEIGAATRSAMEHAAKYKLDQEKIAVAKTDLATALATYESAQKAVAASARQPFPSCDEAGPAAAPDANATPEASVCTALKNLHQLGDAGVKALSEERIKSIEQTLMALHGDVDDKDLKDLPVRLALLNTSVRLSDALKNYHNAATLPSLDALLIEKQLLAGRLDMATRGAALEQRRVVLAQEIAAAYMQELDLLVQARSKIGVVLTTHAKDSLAQLTAQTSTPKTGEPPARTMRRALDLYADSYTLGRIRTERARNQLIMLDYREAQLQSQGALVAWDSLIATPLVQLQTYHGGGIKPMEVAQLIVNAIQAAGVVTIATK